jgi:hypothetical protein
LPFLPTGSLHVAHHADEAAVLREFAEIGPTSGYSGKGLEPGDVLKRSQAIRVEFD